jgi:hypothetical protein
MMTIEEKGIVDFIEINHERGVANLVISDHLAWEEVNRHLLLVQEKINEYLSFIESGNLFEARADLRALRLVIKLTALFLPPPEARTFYDELQRTLASYGYPFIFEGPES